MTRSAHSALPPAETNRHIEITPDICGGKPRLAGTRIRVQDIVIWHERLNLSADEIASRFPQTDLAGIYAALSYYHDHRAQIDEQLRQGEAMIEELRRAFPSKVTAKLKTPA